MKKQQKPTEPQAPTECAIPPALEEYLRRAERAFHDGMQRVITEAAPPTVTPGFPYVEKLCATAREHQVDVTVDLRAGIVSVRAKDFYTDYPRGMVGSAVAGTK